MSSRLSRIISEIDTNKRVMEEVSEVDKPDSFWLVCVSVGRAVRLHTPKEIMKLINRYSQ
jgi:hypothetical protein